jgi:hypothetical protein
VQHEPGNRGMVEPGATLSKGRVIYEKLAAHSRRDKLPHLEVHFDASTILPLLCLPFDCNTRHDICLLSVRALSDCRGTGVRGARGRRRRVKDGREPRAQRSCCSVRGVCRGTVGSTVPVRCRNRHTAVVPVVAKARRRVEEKSKCTRWNTGVPVLRG